MRSSNRWRQMRINRLGRREFITLLGSAATAWPLAARAQQPAMPVVGFLRADTPAAGASAVAAFRKGLSETGFVEGRNLAIEFRWAQNDRGRLPELAADLVRRKVDVIAAPTSAAGALAAKALTTTIPIVFSTSGDPVQLGLVASLNRPGGNVTGFNDMGSELVPKELGLLHELLPGAARFGVLLTRTFIWVDGVTKDAQSAAAAIGRQVDILFADTDREIDAAFAELVQKRVDALLVLDDVVLAGRRPQILTLAARHALPAIYFARAWADAGGLMSYGPLAIEQGRQAGIYTGRVLKGEKPSDLPVARGTKFEFIINLATARAIGIEFPPTLLATADEVIE
jgi:putative tryptophan/tyrosine transport system substrate-binding protein